MKQRIVLSILSSILCGSLWAQDVHKDIMAINKAMSPEAYSTIIEYRSYTDNKLTETEKSSVNVNGQKYKMSVAGIVKINNTKVSLTVDNDRKLLIISEPDKQFLNIGAPSSLDSLIKRATSVNFSKKDDNTGRYAITLETFTERYVEIDFDLATFKLKRIYIIFRSKELDPVQDDVEHEKAMEINYLSFTTAVPADNKFYETTSYVVKKGGDYVAAPKYETYKLINLIKPE